MSPGALLLALVVLLLGAAHLFLAGYRGLARIRDRVLTGRTEEGVPLTPEHRRLLYRAEWRPLRRAMAALVVVLCGVLVGLPELTQEPGVLRHVSRALAGVVLAGEWVVGAPGGRNACSWRQRWRTSLDGGVASHRPGETSWAPPLRLL